MSRCRSAIALLALIILAACGGSGPTAKTSPTAPASAPASPIASSPVPIAILVTDSSPTCAAGGPIWQLDAAAQITRLVQGNLLKKPRGAALDSGGQLVVADEVAGILRVDLKKGTMAKVAFGPPWQPRDVAIDRDGNYVVADWPIAPTGGHAAGPPAVYRVTPAGKVTEVLAGAPLTSPHGVALEGDGSIVVADVFGGLYRIGATSGGAVLMAGTARGTAFNYAYDVAIDTDGTYVIADLSGALLRVNAAGHVSVIYQGSPLSTVSLVQPPAQGKSPKPQQEAVGGPRGVIVAPDGSYWVIDEVAKSIFRVDRSGKLTSVFAGGGMCAPADLVALPAA